MGDRERLELVAPLVSGSINTHLGEWQKVQIPTCGARGAFYMLPGLVNIDLGAELMG